MNGGMMGATITNALPDIPRLFTALCEWLACVVYLSVVPLRVPLRRALALAAVGLGTLVGVQYLAGSLPLQFWLAGMALAVLTMWAMVLLASGLSKREASYLTARAFVLAELVASLHWQLVTFVTRGDGAGDSRSRVVDVVLLVVVYGLCFALAWLAERRNFTHDAMPRLAWRDAVSTVAITVVTFAMSNLSFVSTNTPFSGTLGQEVFYIRTLVDLCGFAMLFAQQEQIRSTQASLELASINAQLDSQHAEYLQSKENIEAMGRLAHDLKHQIMALRAELDPAQTSASFERLEASVAQASAQQHTGHPVLDVVVTAKMRTCADRGITFTCVADGKLLDGMDAMDVASLFGNALDNAIEATSRVVDPERRIIRLALFRRGEFVAIQVENYYDATLRRDADGALATTKRDCARHGFGVKSIRHIASAYGGELSIDPADHWFRLQTLLPLPLRRVR